MIRKTVRLLAITVLLLNLLPIQAHAQVPQIPEIPAFLPTMMDVPATQKSPIDGEWVISSIRKRIKIDAGRAYALDPWLHLFVLKIEPLMVVIKNIQRTAPGRYVGEDLPLVGTFNATLMPNGYLAVNVAGMLGPVNYNLIPVRLDNPQALESEKALATGAVQQPVQEPQPANNQSENNLANCQNLDVDPATGNVICKD